MMKTKKALSILLAVLLLTGCMVTAFADSGIMGKLTWTYDPATKTLTISGAGEMPYYFFPSSTPSWFIYNYDTGESKFLFEIEHLIIENGVTNIGGYAFSLCRTLTSVTIPDSVTSIGDHAFWNCTALTLVTIPSSVTSIGWGAFLDCDALTEVNYTGSEAQWSSIRFDEKALPQGVTVNYNYGAQPENLCKWCGKVHEGFFQGIIGFFHRIFAAIFGAKY